MNRILQIVIIFFANVYFFSVFIDLRAQQSDPSVLKCFNKKFSPPARVGGLDVVVSSCSTSTYNPYPEKKRWGDTLTPADFEKRDRLPNEILRVSPVIRVWTSCLWEGWLKVGCSVEIKAENKVLIEVSYCGFSSGTWFLRDRSGRVVSEVDKNILNHEQGHFDVVELGRRRWQNRAEFDNEELLEMARQNQIELSLTDSAEAHQFTISKKARELIEQLANQPPFIKILNRLQHCRLTDTGWAEGVSELYDRQTKYGTDSKEQQRWEEEIRQILNEQ